MSLRDVTFVVEDGSLGNSGSTGTGVHVKIGASPVEAAVPILITGSMKPEQIKEKLEATRFDSSIYITVDTLKYLKKGGRITPAAAALGTLLKIKPVLTIQGEKLDAFAKARTMKQAKTIMLTALAHDLEERLADPKAEHTYLQIAHTCSEQAAHELEETVRELYPGVPVFGAPLSLSIGCHIGPGALAVACIRKLKELE